MGGIITAIKEAKSHPTRPVDGAVILCIERHMGRLAAADLLVRAIPDLANFTALGLAGSELPFPPQQFRNVYGAAKSLDLNRVAHAGVSVCSMLQLRTKRSHSGPNTRVDNYAEQCSRMGCSSRAPHSTASNCTVSHMQAKRVDPTMSGLRCVCWACSVLTMASDQLKTLNLCGT
jgi:Adenosine deaminase